MCQSHCLTAKTETQDVCLQQSAGVHHADDLCYLQMTCSDNIASVVVTKIALSGVECVDHSSNTSIQEVVAI